MLESMWRRWWLIIGVVLALVAAFLVTNYLQPLQGQVAGGACSSSNGCTAACCTWVQSGNDLVCAPTNPNCDNPCQATGGGQCGGVCAPGMTCVGTGIPGMEACACRTSQNGCTPSDCNDNNSCTNDSCNGTTCTNAAIDNCSALTAGPGQSCSPQACCSNGTSTSSVPNCTGGTSCINHVCRSASSASSFSCGSPNQIYCGQGVSRAPVCCGAGACNVASNGLAYCALGSAPTSSENPMCWTQVGCWYEICMGNIFVCDDGDDCTQDGCIAGGNQNGVCEHQPWVVPVQGCPTGTNGGDGGGDGGDNAGGSSAPGGGSSGGSSTGSSGGSSSAGSSGSTGGGSSGSAGTSSNANSSALSSSQSSSNSPNIVLSSSTMSCVPANRTCAACVTRMICVTCPNAGPNDPCTQSCKQLIPDSRYPDGVSCTPCGPGSANPPACPSSGSSQSSQVSSGASNPGSSQPSSGSSAPGSSTGSSGSNTSPSSSGSSRSSISSCGTGHRCADCQPQTKCECFYPTQVGSPLSGTQYFYCSPESACPGYPDPRRGCPSTYDLVCNNLDIAGNPMPPAYPDGTTCTPCNAAQWQAEPADTCSSGGSSSGGSGNSSSSSPCSEASSPVGGSNSSSSYSAVSSINPCSSNAGSNGSSSTISVPNTHTICFQSACVYASGPGPNQCNTTNDCAGTSSQSFSFSGNPTQHAACQGEACVALDGPGPNQCAPEFGCGDVTHTICENQACVLVTGPGGNECLDEFDCGAPNFSSTPASAQSSTSFSFSNPLKHLGCQGAACAILDGPGPNTCSQDLQCGTVNHTVCRNAMCELVAGPGANQCDDPFDCLPPGSSSSSSSHSFSTPFHAACSGVACTIVPGAGPNACTVALDCGITSHTICRNAMCEIVPGPGGNQCDDPFDCPPFSSSSASFAFSVPLAFCGDGIVQPPESCDNGPGNSDTSSGACRTDCTPARCGDFVVDTTRGETCDQGIGNKNDVADRCRLTCQLPSCGDGTKDSGEQCDDGNLRSNDGCSQTCTDETVLLAGHICGDGRLDPGESCDDGNRRSNDGCSATCSPELTGCTSDAQCSIGTCENGSCVPCATDRECSEGSRCFQGSCVPTGSLVASTLLCGDGTRSGFEECDDSNLRDRDGCSIDCYLERGFCGDGIVQRALDETCEPSLHDKTLSFSCNPATCRFLSSACGDARLDEGEECDLGAEQNSFKPQQPGQAGCRPDCSAPRCGDRILDASESCDDGNRLSNDGCSAFCTLEQGAATIPFPDQQPGSDTLNPLQGFPFGDQTQPWATLQPISSRPPIGDTGPAAVLAIVSGAAAGYGWMRRRRRP